MQLNLKNFINFNNEKYVTAAILIAIVLLIGLLDIFVLTWAFLGGVYLLAIHEALRLYDIDEKNIYIFAAVTWVVAAFYPNPEDLFFIAVLFIGSFVGFKNRVLSIKEGDKEGVAVLKAVAPLVYPALPMLFLLSLYKDYGMASLFWLLMIVASTDIAAYFVGRTFGMTPLSIASPAKSFEGAVGGLIAGSAVGIFMGMTFLPFLSSLIIAFCVSLSSIFGDLLESSIKRAAGVKDSGTILPGHGGVLDRIDGYLFGGVAMTVLVRWLG